MYGKGEKKKSLLGKFFGKKNSEPQGPEYDYLFKILEIVGTSVNNKPTTSSQPNLITDITLSEKQSSLNEQTKIRTVRFESLEPFISKDASVRSPRPPHGCIFYLAGIDEDQVKKTIDTVQKYFGTDMPFILVGSPIHSARYQVTAILDSATKKIDVLTQISQVILDNLVSPSSVIRNN
ncbi:hypothetical protein [Legionella bononiensis]|uniref:Uncharacterized protein n=1 Tax=Legionella bononiensis TaxID=2793102 RepID=A0ABS1W768_9GAMM|nr:hypothetical protein [Legionella bononiensis]MBL7481297.1 hypothetical protein [Legionella bononiensis]MBL7525201.1 hypothetical protein [Legionella bononiensis]MBL7561384.1 hypothetical protein [Legionella bononiensis]